MCDYYGDLPPMRRALELARQAAEAGEVPVGAVVTYKGQVIAEGRNRREETGDPTAHAECEALRAAARVRNDWRLTGCTLYVTLEPCPMCAGAIVNARVDRLVYGAADPAAGCVGSNIQLFALDFCHTPRVTPGVLAEECAAVLSRFFADRRGPGKNP